MLQSVPIGRITADTTTQARVAINMEVAEEYAAAIKSGAKFPPMVVFKDEHGYYLADGFHRLQAYKNNGVLAIECEVHNGTRADAVLHAVAANDRHGLRRTNADKRRSVELLLSLEAWREKSAREIADQCGVSHELAASVRKALAEHGDAQLSESDSFSGKDGKRRRRPRKPTAKKGSRAKRAKTDEQVAKEKAQAALSELKDCFKSIAKIDEAYIGRFQRKDLGKHFDAAILFLDRLCKSFQENGIDLTGVTDIPDSLNRDAWAAWLAYRKEAKLKSYTPTSAKKQMEALAKHPAEKQQEIVETSIRNQYQGLFPSGSANGTGKQSRKPSAVERAQRATGGGF